MKQHLSVGHSLYCDLCPKPDEGITRFEAYNTSELYATMAWIGTKPDLTLVNEYQKVYNDLKRGGLVSLLMLFKCACIKDSLIQIEIC